VAINLDQPVSRLKGVGPSLAKRLAKLRITSVGDLVNHYPRRYDDFSQVVPIRQARPGQITIKGQVKQIATRRAQRRRLFITEAIISDSTGTLKAIWFNQPYLAQTIPTGTDVYVSGRLEFKNSDLALQSPAIELVDAGNKDTARIIPIYPETDGLSSKQLRSLILPLLPDVLELPETLPSSVLKSASLLPRGLALASVHYPPDSKTLENARRRLAFEELFELVLTGLVIKQEIKTETAPVIELNVAVAKQFVSCLGFELTDAQRKAAWQILQDLSSDQPMNRLLEGDVGSGKTIVATMAAVMAMSSGYQAVLMVPTEILARQHHAKLTPVIEAMGFKTALVLGGKKAGNIEIPAEPCLLIGTHALLSERVVFHNLGLVVVDEQHRFGVSQRQALKSKARHLPHLLSMTATPIPRSLALTVYGDLDISVIDALPPGRGQVTTKVVKPNEREQIYQQVDQQIASGRQVFVVCPLIEESDKLGARSAVAEAERLRQGPFKHRRLELLHGRLTADQKAAVMTAFAAGEIDILVSTTVIEVGIDVPNATVMMVEGADRFGLATLHQLRGRVGRGGHDAYCFLLYDNLSTGVAERLAALERTNDGFRLAQIDLELRGPGEIYGSRQHGVLDLRLADIGDVKLLALTRDLAHKFLQKPSALVRYPCLMARINALKGVTTLD
jgi:ATP-dependent DNA helicase RecG